jgi:3-isopropylmalate dehydrogenase
VKEMVKERIVVLPGDGIGPEVMEQALRVVSAVEKASKLDFEVKKFSSGWQYFSDHGKLWEEGALEACQDWADAILHGAVGWPGARPENWSPADGSVVMDLRYGLDLYANVRPVRLLNGVPIILGNRPVKVWDEKDVELVIVRENLEGLYFGARSSPFPDGQTEIQVDERPITRAGSDRISRFAFREAVLRARRGKREWEGTDASEEEMEDERYRPSVTCVDKSNVLPGCALFRQVFDLVSKGYPGVKTKHQYADAFQLALLRDPSVFDVVVTTNLIGDLVSDLAAVLQGGLGMAPSANIGDRKAMFEPVHGSAPDIAGKGLANPTGMILSVGMMFDWLGWRTGEWEYIDAASLVNTAVKRHYGEGSIRTPDIGGTGGTEEVTDSILAFIK